MVALVEFCLRLPEMQLVQARIQLQGLVKVRHGAGRIPALRPGVAAQREMLRIRVLVRAVG